MKGPGGIDLVEMASDGIWVKKTRIIQQAVKKRVIMDGSDELANEHIDLHFGAEAKNMMGNGGVANALPAALPMTNALPAPAPGPLAITFPGQVALPPPGAQPPGAQPPGAQPGANPVSTPSP